MAARLAIVLSHPTQYYSPWFRWLRSHTALEFRVFYLWDFGVTAQRDRQFEATVKWDIDLLSGYDHEFVPGVAGDPGTHHFSGLDNPSLGRRLAAWRPGALLLFGYKWKSHLRAIAWARRKRVPLLLRGDSHFIGRGPPSFLRRLPLALLFSQFAGFLHVGAANRDYFSTLGVPARRLFFAPHAVDATLFDPTQPAPRAAAAATRAQLGLTPETKVVLFAGKFLPAKQPVELLRAFLALNPPETALVFVGDGPERDTLVQLSASARPGSVFLLPFANQSEMPARLLLADLLVLPSGGLFETWGLVVNEAMCLGVPALVSDRVGCQRDLVIPGETGWVFQHDDPVDLKRQLAAALTTMRNPEHAQQLRLRVRSRIAGYSYAQTTQGLLTALAAIGAAGQ